MSARLSYARPKPSQSPGAGSTPVVLLTGFLGAGKTTLLNRLLRAAHGLRLAVLVNEFGALGIDTRLVAGAGSPVVELANGCICCATAGDLMRALDDVLRREPAPDGVLIETSGLADPGPVAKALETWRFARALRVGGIVTVVDAANFDDNLEAAEAAYQQLVAADLVLINKVDLVETSVAAAIDAAIHRLNAGARTIACVRADVPAEVVLGIEQGAARPEVNFIAAHAQPFESVTLSVPAVVDPRSFDAWLDTLPREVYRGKGLLRFKGRSGAHVFHLVGGRRAAEPLEGSDAETTGLVLIGRNLSGRDFQVELDRCAG